MCTPWGTGFTSAQLINQQLGVPLSASSPLVRTLQITLQSGYLKNLRMMLPLYKRLFSQTTRKNVALRNTGLVTSAPDRNASGVTCTQELFNQWNAERLGISPEELTYPEPRW